MCALTMSTLIIPAHRDVKVSRKMPLIPLYPVGAPQASLEIPLRQVSA